MDEIDYCFKKLDLASEHIELKQLTLAIECLVSLMQHIVSGLNEVGNLQQLGLVQGKREDQQLFWNRLNAVWLSIGSTEDLRSPDWIALRDAVQSFSNILELYGLVDYPLGFQESLILANLTRLAMSPCATR